MFPKALAFSPERPRGSTILDKIRKIAPSTGRAGTVHPVHRHLERLAQSSPHLLPDLGFVEDRRVGNLHRAVWRNGPLVISVSRDPGAVTTRVEVRADA